MLEVNNSIINIDDKVSPEKLAGLLGVNVSLLYQHSQMGRLPPVIKEATYRECVQTYLNWYKKNQDLKIEKEKNEQELRLAKEANKSGRKFSFGEDGDTNEGMPPLAAAKIKTDIRLNLAKEQQLQQRVAIERGDYTLASELLGLCTPFVSAIRDMLLNIALDFPETRGKIDQCMESLFKLGTQLIENADVDTAKYVKTMLEKELDLENL